MTRLRLRDDVARRHRHIDTASHGTIHVVGDVHGCIAELQTLWDRLNPASGDLVVFVGDLVGKGPASDDVVEFVRTRDNAVSVRGNNEELVLRGLAEADLSPESRDAIASFPLVVTWDDAMVVHGGVRPDRALVEHGPQELLETRAIPPENGYRGPFWFDAYEGPPRVFFGHTVLSDPFVGEWSVGLDTGCVHGRQLTAYDCDRDAVVRVPAEQTYRHRSDDRMVHV